MRDLALFLHLAGAILWMGGMGFMLLALRPVLHEQLPPPARLPLIAAVLHRFFIVVGASVAALLVTGGGLLLQAPGSAAPPGWHAMAALGVVMALVFGHLWFAPYRRLRAAVAAGDWPEGGRQMARMTKLVQLNFALGWIAIAAVLAWR